MNRAERRFRTQKKYNKRAKLFLNTWLSTVPCDIDELPEHLKNRYRLYPNRKALNYKDLQKHSKTMQLYKNTGTIWTHSYWDKWEIHIKNKQSRQNAKKEIIDELNNIND